MSIAVLTLGSVISALTPDYKAALKADNVNYTAHFYSVTQHSFHHDSASLYEPKAAEPAWSHTVEFLNNN
ncbi:MAG: carboxymethylenebutenolidase [Paraglaciecola sp.]